ncbi:MAG: 50S ribosomal protein L32e [Thermoplasmata archaeon]
MVETTEPKAAPEPVPPLERAGTAEPAADAEGPRPTPKKSEGRARRRAGPEEKGPATPKSKKGTGPRAPNRPTLDPETRRLLGERRRQDARRPLFVRQQSHRYFAIGRFGSWRRPRGQQSKQRRHYGYRPTVVSIGFRSPRRTRGLTPSGFVPVIVRTTADIERLEAIRQAALIARTVGTRKRLILEEAARKRGIHVLNPLLRERREAT